MLRYKTETRPGLVALYDIRPGNGAGQFLQPQSPHGATVSVIICGQKGYLELLDYEMGPTFQSKYQLRTKNQD